MGIQEGLEDGDSSLDSPLCSNCFNLVPLLLRQTDTSSLASSALPFSDYFLNRIFSTFLLFHDPAFIQSHK